MVKEIRIYCEGGSAKRDQSDLLKRGLNIFFQELVGLARAKNIRWRLTLCKSRNLAFEGFETAMKSFPEAFNVLLVDSEAPVTSPAWQHLKQTDKWRLTQEQDSQCHLMAQAMEAWLIADLETLKKHYGQSFNANPIPTAQNVEQIAKDRLAPMLNEATRQTQKGKYDKIKHAGEILQKLDVAKVRQAAPHCDRLFKTLAEKMDTDN